MTADQQLRVGPVVQQAIEYIHRQGLLCLAGRVYCFGQVVDSTVSWAEVVKTMRVVAERR